MEAINITYVSQSRVFALGYRSRVFRRTFHIHSFPKAQHGHLSANRASKSLEGKKTRASGSSCFWFFLNIVKWVVSESTVYGKSVLGFVSWDLDEWGGRREEVGGILLQLLDMQSVLLFCWIKRVHFLFYIYINKRDFIPTVESLLYYSLDTSLTDIHY